MAASAVVGSGEATTSVMRPVNIRRDLAAMADLIELCFGPTMDESGRAVIREMRMISKSGPLLWAFAGLDKLVGGLEQGFVWFEGTRLIGNVSVSPAEYPREMGKGYIIANVAVHPDFRRRGIARALMNASLELIRSKGGAFAILNVEAENEGARRLYTDLGFREERTFVRWHRPPHVRPPRRPAEMPFITLRQGREWREEYALAQLVRPNARGGLGWQRPVHASLFRPSLWGGLRRALSGQSDERWIIRKEDGRGIAASLHAARGFGGPYRLTLLVHPAYQGQCEAPLLNYALRRLDQELRPVQIEHPDDDLHTGALLAELGFERRTTVVHMRYAY